MGKEQHLIMSAASVEAIRLKQKTATRRVIKPEWSRCLDLDDPDDQARAVEDYRIQAGQRVWVKERYRLAHINAAIKGAAFLTVQFSDFAVLRYRPDWSDVYEGMAAAVDQWEKGETGINFGPWRSPMFMPRFCTRMLLKVKAVRVELLHEIDELGALAEGTIGKSEKGVLNGVKGTYVTGSARDDFAATWDELNAKRGYPWEDNPHVFVIEFELDEYLIRN